MNQVVGFAALEREVARAAPRAREGARRARPWSSGSTSLTGRVTSPCAASTLAARPRRGRRRAAMRRATASACAAVDDEHHADAQVERRGHLVVVDRRPSALELGEDPRHLDARAVERRAPRPVGQRAGEVGRDARRRSRGPRRGSRRGARRARGGTCGVYSTLGSEQHVVERCASAPSHAGSVERRGRATLEQHVARERVAVGAQPARGERDERVARRRRGRDRAASSRSTTPTAKPARSNWSGAMTPGVLGGLAAEQRARRPRGTPRRCPATSSATRSGSSDARRRGSRGRRAARPRCTRGRRRTSRRGRARPSTGRPPARATSSLVPTPSVVGHEHRVAPPALAQREPAGEPADPAEDARAGPSERSDDRRSARRPRRPRRRRHRRRRRSRACGPVTPRPRSAPRTSRGTRVGYRPVRHASQNPAPGASIASTRCSRVT